jgi:parvulin-like peptidyl-prolyl isomerase
MKKLLFCAVAFMMVAANAVEVDGVAATVGNVTILRSDVLEEMMRRGISDESRYVEFRNRLVERELILKAATKAKLTMQDWVVDDRIRAIVDDSFGGDRIKLEAMLVERKISEVDWRRKIKEDMVVAAMRWTIVDKFVTASPSEMREEYEKYSSRYSAGDKVSVSVILLSPENEAKKTEITNLLKKEDFSSLAKKYSADKRAKEGGAYKDIVAEDEFSEVVCKEIAKTPKGAISQWIEIGGWNFLLRKDDEKSSAKRAFVDAYADIEANVKEAKSKRLYDEWIERLKAETYIKIH